MATTENERPPIPADPPPQRPAWKLCLPPLLLLAIGIFCFPSSGYDDPYITYAAAWQLSHHAAILNYSGNRVEMSSTLLFTVLLALLNKLSALPLPLLGHILSMLFGMITVFACSRIAEHLRPGAGLIAGILAATSLPLLFWSFSGMEFTLAATLYLWLATTMGRLLAAEPKAKTWHALLPIALASTVRPELPICTLCLAIVGIIIAARPGRLRPALILLALCLLCAGILVAFRFFYFGDIVPQPVRAKLGLGAILQIAYGFVYFIVQSSTALFWLLLAAAAAGISNTYRRGNIPALIIGASGGIYLLFAITSGGDWMNGGRFLVAAAPSLCIMASLLLKTLKRPIYTSAAIVTAQLAAAIYFAVAGIQPGMLLPTALANYSKPYTATFGMLDIASRSNFRDMETVRYMDTLVPAIYRHTHRPVSLCAFQMGMVLYNLLTRAHCPLEITDTYGLQDRTLTSKNLPAYVHHGRQGLEHADRYYWQLVVQNHLPLPDTVYVFTGTNPYIAQHYTREMDQSGDLRTYDLTYGWIPNPSESIYVRNDLAHSLHLHPYHCNISAFRYPTDSTIP